MVSDIFDIKRDWQPSEQEYKGRDRLNSYPIVANGEAVGASATATLISQIAQNEKVFLTGFTGSVYNSGAYTAGSLCITDTSGNSILVIAKIQTSTGVAQTTSRTFTKPVQIKPNQELRVINANVANTTSVFCCDLWVETY